MPAAATSTAATTRISATTRAAMDLLFERAWRAPSAVDDKEFVTGNNDADGVYLLHVGGERVSRTVSHTSAPSWRSGAAIRRGVNVANIDNLGNVHPDTFWWHYSLGNVRDRPFSAIWADLSDPIMAGLKSSAARDRGALRRLRPLRRLRRQHARAGVAVTGNAWAEDPGCYLTDAEIGVTDGQPRVPLTPYRSRSPMSRRG